MKAHAGSLQAMLLMHIQLLRRGRRIVKITGCYLIGNAPSAREYRPTPLRPPLVQKQA
jgi:hypothetical protein